jgi:hypothetical protein
MRCAALSAIAIAVGLSACASAPKMLWMRADGQSAANDPVLAQQFQMDKTVCLGEREKADLSGVTVTQGGLAGVAASISRSNAADAVTQGCMAEKGYVLVREDQVAQKHQELAAIAAEKAQREAAAAAAAAPPSPRETAAIKPKPRPAPATSNSLAQPVSLRPSN